MIDYSKGEKRYIKAIKKWLTNEKEYFKEIQPFFEESNTKLIEKNIVEIKNSIKNIEFDFGEFKFLINKLSIEQKNGINSVLSNLENIDESVFRADWNNLEIQTKLEDIINTINITQEDKEKMKKEIKKDAIDLSVKNKLKFIIPLIFFKYEAEIELSDKQKLPQSWKDIKSLFLK